MALGETPVPGIPEREEAQTPLQPRSLFRNAVVQNTQATKIRQRTRTAVPDGAAGAQSATDAEPREATFKIEKVLKVMQDMDKFTGEGKPHHTPSRTEAHLNLYNSRADSKLKGI